MNQSFLHKIKSSRWFAIGVLELSMMFFFDSTLVHIALGTAAAFAGYMSGASYEKALHYETLEELSDWRVKRGNEEQSR